MGSIEWAYAQPPQTWPGEGGESKVFLLFNSSVANFRHKSASLLFGGMIVLWCSLMQCTFVFS